MPSRDWGNGPLGYTRNSASAATGTRWCDRWRLGKASTGRGQYYMQTGHQHNPALSLPNFRPSDLSVAYEYATRRRETDSLPPFVGFNTFPQVGLIGSGFLPGTFAPFHINTSSDISAIAPRRQDLPDFERRWELLKQFDGRVRTDPALEKKAYRDFHNYYEGAVEIMSDPRSASIFRVDPEERQRYGSNPVGDSFVLARNLVLADAGTHFIFLTHEDWDHHGSIYKRENFYKRSSGTGRWLEPVARRPRGGTAEGWYVGTRRDIGGVCRRVRADAR